MLHTRTTTGVASMFLLASLALALPGKPNFAPAVYGDGKLWGTKAAANIPGPNDENMESFDKLFVIVNGAVGQMPVDSTALLYNSHRPSWPLTGVWDAGWCWRPGVDQSNSEGNP